MRGRSETKGKREKLGGKRREERGAGVNKLISISRKKVGKRGQHVPSIYAM